jgi:DNA topoisomerase-3
MTKRLIIAEKPDMGKKIAAALPGVSKNGGGYIEVGSDIVTWCIGHIMKAYDPEDYNKDWAKWSIDGLPMIIQEWKIKVDPDKTKQFKIIKELIPSVDLVINAGDPGREGQLIVDEVLFYLNNKKPVQRILLHALDKKSIHDAFTKLEDNKKFKNLYNAGVCRGYADWLMGMNATRLYTLVAQKSGYKGVLSVGRVQSPTLAIVVNRDEEIENFVSKDYYVIVANHEHNSFSFNSYWKDNEKTDPTVLDLEKRLISKVKANEIVNKVKNKVGIVSKYEEKDNKESAPLPFNLSKLQIYANAKWGMSAKDVLDTCQSLYEKHELQTYPRTDCEYLPENQLGDANIILSNISKSIPAFSKVVGGADLNIKSHAWDDSKLGEHFGLIPTKKVANLTELNEFEKKIYEVVCQRYIMQFYPVCEYKSAKVVMDCENESFVANGKTIQKYGWRTVLGNINEDLTDQESASEEEDQVFPNMSIGQKINFVNSTLKEKKTTPPPRFTEGTLLKAMTNVHTLVSDPEQKKKLKEKKGIGQEATRTQVFESLFKRNLLLKRSGKLISSDAARSLIKALPKKIIDPALTAIWEDALDKIANGSLSPELFKEKQNQWVAKLVSEGGEIKLTNLTPNAKVCSKCGVGVLVERTAKKTNKKFIGCSNWPKCDFVEWKK